jgi:hypothetical protein
MFHLALMQFQIDIIFHSSLVKDMDICLTLIIHIFYLKFVKINNISPDTSEGYEYIPDTDVGTDNIYFP